MTTGKFHGLFAIAVTPFDDDENVDDASLEKLCEFYLEKGATGIVALGILGEAHRLLFSEATAIARRILAIVGGRVPVYFGASNPAIKVTQALTQEVMSRGAAGIMVAPLPNQKDEGQILAYLEGVARSVGGDVPIILQDYPQETNTYLSAALIARAVQAIPSLCAFKHEDWPGLSKLSALRAETQPPAVRNLPILVGNGALFLPLELARGANGAMTGFSFPEVLVQICALFDAGKRDEAEDLYDKFLPFLRYEHQPVFGLAVRKYVLYRRGVIASAKTRTPGYQLRPADIADIEHFMARLGVSFPTAR
ncbi:MAG: dihydrodipicolinate synthase family protein [Sterolibacterium sp.]|jgi:4-hydroxy-tetrahydrodipicolinate synthase